MIRETLTKLGVEIVRSDRDTVTIGRADMEDILATLRIREATIRRLILAATTTSPLLHEVVRATMSSASFVDDGDVRVDGVRDGGARGEGARGRECDEDNEDEGPPPWAVIPRDQTPS